MPVEQVDPFATVLISSYQSAAADARAFKEEWGLPPTRMDRSHRFRSIVQARVQQSDRFALHSEFMESGRVQVTDRITRRSFLVRSRAALDIEQAFRGPEQLALFDEPLKTASSRPELLVYTFERDGMRVWICPTKQAKDQRRLLPAGELDFVGFWSFHDRPPPGGGGTFDQGAGVAFRIWATPTSARVTPRDCEPAARISRP